MSMFNDKMGLLAQTDPSMKATMGAYNAIPSGYLDNYFKNPGQNLSPEFLSYLNSPNAGGNFDGGQRGLLAQDNSGRGIGYTMYGPGSQSYDYDQQGKFLRQYSSHDNGPGDFAKYMAVVASLGAGAAAMGGASAMGTGATTAAEGAGGLSAGMGATSGAAPSLSGTAFSGGMAPAGMGYSTGAGALGTGATSFGTGALGMDAAMGSFGAGLGAAGAAGGSGGGGLNSMFDNPTFKQFGGKLLTSGLSSALSGSGGGGGSTNNSGGGFGNMGLSDLFNVGAGVYGAHQQNQAASKFTDWMNGQQDYIRNYGAPDSPEFNYLKQTLENQDAAAGRNSQYGTRATELLGKLGQAKLDASSRMALGFASPYQKALNQQANAGINVTSPLAKMLQGSGGNLSSLLNGLSGGSGVFNNGSNMSAQDTLNQIGPEGMPIDYGNGMADPTEQDVLEFLNNHPDSGEFMDWWS